MRCSAKCCTIAERELSTSDLLSRDEVTGHDFVYDELLIGDKGGRKALLAEYGRMDQAPVVTHSDVAAFVRDRKLHGPRRWMDRRTSSGVGTRGSTRTVDD